MSNDGWIQEGKRLPLFAPYDVAPQAGALIGDTFGVWSGGEGKAVLALGEEGTFELEGVWRLAKATGASTGGAQGAKAYFVTSTKLVTAVASTNKLIGFFANACADGDTTANVRLNSGTV
jgi:predicted RecA/RadA family phage recombinase